MIDALTGLRFIAAAIVVFVHIGNLSVGHDLGLGKWAANAVAFFFVLSGFILTYVYSQRGDSLKKSVFYVARLARIWPLHLTCFALAFAVQWYYLGFQWDAVMLRRLVTNVLLIHSWMPEAKAAYWFNGPSWSISTELAFYLAFPLLLFLFNKRPALTSVGILLLTLTSLTALQVMLNMGWITGLDARYFCYVNPLFRFFDFAVGIMVGRLYLKQQSKFPSLMSTLLEVTVAGLIPIIGGLFLFSVPISSWIPGAPTLVAFDAWIQNGGGMVPLYAALIYLMARSTGLLSRVLSHPISVYLGEISFALYLVQYPVIELVRNLSHNTTLPASFLFVATVVTCLSAAALLHGLVEMPLRNGLVNGWKHAENRKRWATWTAYQRELLSPIPYTAILLITEMLLAIARESQLNRLQTTREQLALMWDLSQTDFQEPIVFEGQAILRSVTVQQDDDESLILRFLWQKLPGWNRSRFVHILDDQGKIIAHGTLATDLFANAKDDELLMDQCVLPAAKLKKAALIGVGFFAKDMGTVRVYGSQTSMGGHRLEILTIDENGPQLIPQKAGDFPATSVAEQPAYAAPNL